MGYPKGLLENRSVVKPGSYTVITDEGRVVNSIPGFEGCAVTVLASPRHGASFVQYIATVSAGGKTTRPFVSDPAIETFIYVLDGEGSLRISINGRTEEFNAGGYAYAAPGEAIEFENASGAELRVLMYKQRYVPLEDLKPWTVFGHINDIEERIYDGMANVWLRDLLPSDWAFDMNMHTLRFEPDGCHPFVETHMQEHGAYVTSGQGIYLLGEDWVQTKKEDFIWFGPFCQQATYATGRESFSYIYSKDHNRDAEI